MKVGPASLSRDSPNHDDYKQLLRDAVCNEEAFLQMVLSQPRDAAASPWVRVKLRPVEVKGRRHVQFVYSDGRKEVSKNYAGDELLQRLDEVLALPFAQAHVQATTGDLHVRITRKGKALVSRGKPSRQEAQPDLVHDRQKAQPLATGKSDAYLQLIGVTDAQGRVRPAMRAKFRQINQFLRIIEETVARNQLDQAPIRVVDCGCGAAYLTFAAYHYLNHIRGLAAEVIGVDVNAEIIESGVRLRDELGWERLSFQASTIAAFQPAAPPHIVLSLHACDTATDEAIAQGIRWGSQVILAAPCCQHELHHQLHVPLFQPVLRHGILRERLADILTDAFRALILRIMGYRTSVFEFVSPEHTSKNLMIQAERGLPPGDPAIVQEYEALKAYWGVTPVLEKLLEPEIARISCNEASGSR